MAPEQFLDYEMALLLAKYGERRVAGALAAKLGVAQEDLERKLVELNRARPRRASRRPPDASRIVEALAEELPEKAPSLRLLFTRYQNKTFLPELKDVRRFLQRHANAVGRLKSRAEVAPTLFKLLSTMGASELQSLCEDGERQGYSSLGIISDEIMRSRS